MQGRGVTEAAKEKRVILITGGNSAMALATADVFLGDRERDWRIWLGVRSNREHAAEFQGENPGPVSLVDLEVTESAAWEGAVEQIVRTDGRLDVLVNNAGFHRDALLATMTDEDWESVIDSNLRGAFLGCRAVIPTMMKERYGRIVNVASLSALLAPRGQANYAAAKAGVVAMSQSLAKETARAGITVNSVCPGYIDTPALASMDRDHRKALAREIPMRRFGKPEEVAHAIRFLACPDASYITGSVLKIDGGIF